MEYTYKGTIAIPEYNTPTERENNDLTSELYSILFTINSIEKIFIKSIFKTESEKEQYSNSIDELLLQWNSIIDSLNINTTTSGDFEYTIKSIFSPYFENSEIESLKFGLRRIKIGVNGFEEKEKEREKEKELDKESDNKADSHDDPTTPAPTTTIDNKGKKAIAEATSAFITLMDAIKLNYDSKDTLHPLFSDVLTKSGQISTDFSGRNKLVSWLIQINKMPISETLDEAQLKEMLWDVDSAYNGFFDQL